MTFYDYVVAVVFVVALTACAPEAKDAWPEAQAEQCVNPINGIYENPINHDFIKFNSDCSGGMLTCNINFIYRNPGPNNETMLYVMTRENVANCLDLGYHNCRFNLSVNGNQLVFQCDGTDPVAYNRTM